MDNVQQPLPKLCLEKTMSTFAVFGMTGHFAHEEAREKTPTNVGKTQLTEAQGWRPSSAASSR
jgi:hypothetical protein